ncbi:MAG TPA: T9SS type A sorting domain-containing protein [Chitinophagaceae bacterium]|nr:T9SS type A sorting domain-containing protein [Chitinophagaceae bacterium]
MKKRLLFLLHTGLCTIFLLMFSAGYSQTLDFGKSYINVTKGTNGGTIEPGDTLEIRATFVVRSGTLDSCAFYDTIRAGMAYIPGSMAVLTNEGKVYKSFTDPLNTGDCGWYNAGNIRIHLGFVAANNPATAFRRGQIRNTHRPNVFGACVMVCSYRVRVTASLGSFIALGGGAITYRVGSNPIQRVSYPGNVVAVYRNSGICSNSVGVNALGTEFNGTFGAGRPRNRGTSGNVPASYTYNAFMTNGPGDYYYGIANNTSTDVAYSTVNTWPKPDPVNPTHRVFRVWDIIGDHTGATNQLLGNPAADTVANGNAGYMLVINSSYRIDSAFQHTISGLCPNTYYEISAWMRNVCSKCGNDSANVNASSGNPAYIPTEPGDSSGVRPNVTFEVDGVDYYSTGDMRYTGQWIKKGFTYLTGPSQTAITLKLFNNAPGGGGNDWALDDISVATCTPNLNMIPSGNANVCIGNQVDMACVVRSYFPNYVHWLWERSTDGGVNWSNTGVTGIGSPVLVGGQYQYTATYPSFIADSSAHLTRYRIRVASTAGNLLNPNCSFADVTTIVVWVNNCQWVLQTKLKSFSGIVQDGHGRLQWETENESPNVVYEIESSTDQSNFQKIGQVTGTASGSGNIYQFTDPDLLSSHTYYRIKVREGTNFQYSRIILLSNRALPYEIKSVINPFRETLAFEMIAPADGIAVITLIDAYGRPVKQVQEAYNKGLTNIRIGNLGSLASGTYTLRVQAGAQVFNKKVIRIIQ